MKKKTIFEEKYFYMDATIFDQELSANAMLVYSYLCKCANRAGESWPSHGRIAEACSLAVTTIKKALRELKERRLVSVVHRYRLEGGKTSNLYRISKKWNRVCAVGSQIFSRCVSAKAKLVYIYLCKYSDQEGRSYPSHRTLAGKCGIGLSTVRKALRELAKAAIIHIQEKRRKDRGQSSNLYSLLKMVKNSLKKESKGLLEGMIRKEMGGADAPSFFLESDRQIGIAGIGIKQQGRVLMRL